MPSTGKVFLGLGCVLLVVFGLAMATCASCMSSMQSTAPSATLSTNSSGVSFDDSFEAWHWCKEGILRQLKAPSTAEFIDDDHPANHVFLEKPKGNARQRKLSAKANKEFGFTHFIVQGEVDSQNSFGAKLRSEFECSVTRTKENRWMTMKAQVFTRR